MTDATELALGQTSEDKRNYLWGGTVLGRNAAQTDTRPQLHPGLRHKPSQKINPPLPIIPSLPSNYPSLLVNPNSQIPARQSKQTLARQGTVIRPDFAFQFPLYYSTCPAYRSAVHGSCVHYHCGPHCGHLHCPEAIQSQGQEGHALTTFSSEEDTQPGFPSSLCTTPGGSMFVACLEITSTGAHRKSQITPPLSSIRKHCFLFGGGLHTYKQTHTHTHTSFLCRASGDQRG